MSDEITNYKKFIQYPKDVQKWKIGVESIDLRRAMEVRNLDITLWLLKPPCSVRGVLQASNK